MPDSTFKKGGDSVTGNKHGGEKKNKKNIRGRGVMTVDN